MRLVRELLELKLANYLKDSLLSVGLLGAKIPIQEIFDYN
jgi:hypothetical protein